jgi:hypothetical protein
VNDILKRHPLTGEVFIQPGKFYLQYLGRTVGEYAEFSSRSTTVGELGHRLACFKRRSITLRSVLRSPELTKVKAAAFFSNESRSGLASLA